MLDFEISATEFGVDLWLQNRMPFEPTGQLLTARDSLRDVLKKMRLPEGSRLACEYCSEATEFCDVENVLLYNVGPSVFGHIGGAGIRAARTYAPDGYESPLLRVW